uniref:Titin n=1 Tax=Amphiprion percula TaxID=161767 RepID=A0A3P8STH1_AMPPE
MVYSYCTIFNIIALFPLFVFHFCSTEEADLDLDVSMTTQYTARAGRDVEVFIPLKGRPAPNVTWRRGDRNMAGDNRYTITSTERATTLLIPKVTRDDCGKYMLEIENGVGEPKIITVSLKVLDSPSTCQKLMIKNVTRGKLTLSWEAPLIDGGSPVTNYIVEKKGSTMKAYQVITAECLNTTFKVSGLEEDIAFFFHESKYDFYFTGPFDCANSSFICCISVAPEIEWAKDQVLTLRAGENVKLSCSITGRPLPQIVWYKDGKEIDKRTMIDIEITTGIGTSSVFIRDVDRNHRGVYTVEARNSSGQTHIVKNGGIVTLHVAFRGKPAPLATWSRADGELPVMADVNTTDSFSTLTIEGCTRYEAGKYTLSLENNSGRKSITFTVKVLDTPGPPGAITFKDVTRGALTVMWDAPTNDGGSRIHHYIVDKREASRLAWQEVSTKCTRQMIRAAGLDIGVPYLFRVIAVNQYGQGEPHEMTEPIIATEEPAPPRRLDVVDTTNSTACLVWLKPEHDGGSRIRGYIVEFRAKGTDRWVVSGETKSLKTLVEGLIENTEYDFRVKAKNDAGISEPQGTFGSVVIKEPRIEPTADLSSITNQLITCKASSTFTIDIPIIPPSPPTRPDVVSVSANAISIKWDVPYADGGSKVTGYWIEKKERNTILWVRENKLPCLECHYKVSNLIEGLEYQFRVYAMNLAGLSKASEASRPVVALNPVGEENVHVLTTNI